MNREQIAERRRKREDFEAMMAAAADERSRVNAAIANGKRATISTAFGEYLVKAVSTEWWYTCVPAEGTPDALSTRSFSGCNNDAWDGIMRQVGEPRHPRFAPRNGPAWQRQ